MKLSEFISANMEGILQDFEDFARTHTAAGERMNVPDLRDHAAEMLKAIVLDLGEPQSEREEMRKSKGDASSSELAPRTAAQLHGLVRVGDAFSLNETVAEFRALRASVLRRWESSEEREHGATDYRDQLRFHEAIDQALAESVDRYARELRRLHDDRDNEQYRIAEEVSRARADFIQIVSHELRTPLHAITGYNALLDMGVYGSLTEPQQSVLGRMKSAAAHLLGIIEEILDLRRSGKELPTELEECTVAEAAAGLESLVAPIAKSRGVKFDINVPADGAPLRVDSAKLRQILVNLVRNALDVTPEGGRVWLDYLETEDEGCLRVHDTGPGIPEDKLEVIFEPFVQLDMSLTRERGGVGLGLAISRQLADRMGGRITATSEVGTGSTFKVSLPRARH